MPEFIVKAKYLPGQWLYKLNRGKNMIDGKPWESLESICLDVVGHNPAGETVYVVYESSYDWKEYTEAELDKYSLTPAEAKN